MADQQIDPRIYGGGTFTNLGTATAQSQAATSYTPPERVPVSRVNPGLDLLTEGALNLHENNREKAGVLASVGAAMTQWLPVHAYNYWYTPKFASDPDFNAASFMREQVDYRMDSDDESFMLKAVSAEDARYRLNHLQDRNMAYGAMGDHGVASFLTGVIDPGYLAIDIASLGAARMARLTGASGKLVAGATAGALSYGAGKIEQQVQPTSEWAIVGNALANGAATGMFFKGGKVVPRDPEFPSARLGELADELQAKPRATPEPHTAPDGPNMQNVIRTAEAAPAPRMVSEWASVAGTVEAKTARALEKEGKLVAVASAAEVAQHSSVPLRIAPDAKAVYLPEDGRVVVIADNIQPGDDVRGILLHEVGVHMNAPTALGAETFAKMKDDLQKLADGGSARAKQAFEDVPADTPAASRAEEALGYYVERNHGVLNDSLVSRFKHEVKNKLRSIGLAPMKYSENDIMQLVRKSAKLGSKTEGAGTLTSPVMYSKGLTPLPHSAAVKQALSSKEVGAALEFSWSKSMSKYSEVAAEVSELLMDSPTSKARNSVASIRRAVRADFAALQYAFEEKLLDMMAKQGYGLRQRIIDTQGGVRAQQRIERDLNAEMLRRQRASAEGVPYDSTGVDPDIKAMADAQGSMNKQVLAQMKAAGVAGAEDVAEQAGYLHRVWDSAKLEAVERKFLENGPVPSGYVRGQIVDAISVGIQRANGWDAQLSSDIAGAIYDRAKRKGQFIDAELRGAQGVDAAQQVRDILTDSGVRGDRLERAIETLVGVQDEAGKLNALKRRIDINMDEPIALPDGTSVTIGDLLDSNVSAITDRYLDNAAAQIAFAKKGMTKPSDILDLRKRLADSIPELSRREEALRSYDDLINVLKGLPVGEEQLQAMRIGSALTQMVGLSSSGLWQLTEYAPIMAHYGAGRAISNMVKELPFVRSMVKEEASSLKEVLARNSAQDTRLRPFINKMEDNFDIQMDDTVLLKLQQAKQLVPYANAMKYVQHHQARVTANLIVDTIVRAVKGDAKAAESLGSYGLESGIMVRLRDDINAHGMDTSKWSAATWDAVRAPLTKMMDDSVLRARVGEIPKFAVTSTLGKFLFTFRSFTLAAHNKVLASTLTNQGYAGMSLLLLYQMPLTVLAAAANNELSGKSKTLEATVAQAFTQVGALGLFTELFGVITGEKKQFGTPGLIGLDRLYRIPGAVSADIKSGTFGNTGAALFGATPVLSTILPLKGVGEALKPDTKE